MKEAVPHRDMWRRFCFICLLLLAPTHYSRAENPAASSPQWLALLQISSADSTAPSRVDDSTFFLAPDGKYDPQAEFVGSSEKLLTDAPITGDDDLRCRFPARTVWLAKISGKKLTHLPLKECDSLKEWYYALQVKKITLVYAAQYLNNPASAFGHTLLRLDSSEADATGTPLVSYAANYAANTTEELGLTYAIKGIFGGYTGRFSVSPYYVHLTKYSEMEDRDIWEYQLALTPDEIERLLLHLWELRGTTFDYYFFDENCSLILLSLIEVARPGLGLERDLRPWTVPVDTVRAVLSRPELVVEIKYRPSMGTNLRYRLEQASPEEISEVKIAASNRSTAPLDELSPDALEIGAQYITYRGFGVRGTNRRAYDLLRERSKSSAPRSIVNAPPPDVRPDEGHSTSVIAVGGGEDDDGGYASFKWRPVLHDLLDPQVGHIKNSVVQLMTPEIRLSDSGSFSLERLDVLDLKSLVVQDDLLKPISWRANLGWERATFSDGDRKLQFGVESGAGVTREITPAVAAYLLGVGRLEFANEYREDYGIGVGPEGGLLFDGPRESRLHLSAGLSRFVNSDVHSAIQFGAELSVPITKDYALRLSAIRSQDFDHYNTDLGGSVYWYF